MFNSNWEVCYEKYSTERMKRKKNEHIAGDQIAEYRSLGKNTVWHCQPVKQIFTFYLIWFWSSLEQLKVSWDRKQKKKINMRREPFSIPRYNKSLSNHLSHMKLISWTLAEKYFIKKYKIKCMEVEKSKQIQIKKKENRPNRLTATSCIVGRNGPSCLSFSVFVLFLSHHIFCQRHLHNGIA